MDDRVTLLKLFIALVSMAAIAVILVLLFGVGIFSPFARAEPSPEFIKGMQPADGFKLSVFAAGLSGPRLMVRTTGGDIIVSERRAGTVVLLPIEGENNPIAGKEIILAKGLDGPHGLMIDQGWLYVALQTKVIRYRFDAKGRSVTGSAEILFDGIPSGGHSSRTIRRGPDGWFYVSVGSSCNVCIERHIWRAAILRFKPGSAPEIYATGLRNSVGFDWHPLSSDLYAVDNGRDWLGDDIPPGEVNKITPGGFYGWPYFYGDNLVDPNLGDKYVAEDHGKPIAPAHSFGAHVAPLSLRFMKAPRGGEISALVAQHGSWNRSSKVGYKIVKLSFGKDGSISQSDFLSGFLQREKVVGRPVDTLPLPDGAVLISDDMNGIIWKMTPNEDSPLGRVIDIQD